MAKNGFTTSEIKFLNSIKKQCQIQMELNGVLASIVGAMAITESNWGTAKHVVDTNNLFRILVNETDEEWLGMCYSLDNGSIYESKHDCTSGDTLIRIYDTIEQCIDDHVTNLVTKRRSKGGPFKYRNIIGILDYKECLKNLIRDGYQADRLFDYKDPKYESNMISIIEKYKLSDWDNLSESNVTGIKYTVKTDPDSIALFTTSVLNNAEYVAKNNEGYKVFNNSYMVTDPWNDENTPVFRVRMIWDKSDTQIEATKDLNRAKQLAEKHPGYKVFEGEDGTLVYDPWTNDNIPSPEIPVKNISIYQPGEVIELNNCPIYRTADSKTPFLFLTGKFYFYDERIINDRKRITKSNCTTVINGKDPSKIIGFIKVE